ncbi:hypothetical protein ABRP72_19410 [Pectobacterium carotovorum]|uniref:hypothetical protein n=1 Tax=Pectobacterium carotovorum TaxID=554 RepID=UPI00193761C1|nr:hypothetical protein HG702_22490 [Pectobacterium versatile]
MSISPHILQALQGITLLRTEHGNVIARDDKDNQEFVFAECSSPDIAACILAMVKTLTGEANECE